MSKFMETASAAVTAASLVALVLACALFTRTSWADEPLSGGAGCQGCLTSGSGTCDGCPGTCENGGDGDQCDPTCDCEENINYGETWCYYYGTWVVVDYYVCQ